MTATSAAPAPIPMLLWCPACTERHIDVDAFATKPHHTHACQHCGMVWRPAVVPTVGVKFLPGFHNGPARQYEQPMVTPIANVFDLFAAAGCTNARSIAWHLFAHVETCSACAAAQLRAGLCPLGDELYYKAITPTARFCGAPGTDCARNCVLRCQAAAGDDDVCRVCGTVDGMDAKTTARCPAPWHLMNERRARGTAGTVCTRCQQPGHQASPPGEPAGNNCRAAMHAAGMTSAKVSR